MQDKVPFDEKLLDLMKICQDEWKFRDQLHWSQMYRLFYATLIFTVLPYIAEGVGVDLSKFPTIIFPIAGLIMALMSFFISLGYIKLVDKALDKYNSLFKSLPEEYPYDDMKLKGIFKYKRSYIICISFLILLIILSGVLIYFEIFG